MLRRGSYLWRVFVALDRLINVLAGGRLNETVSERAAHAWACRRRWGCIFCKVLDFFDRDHCERTIADDWRRTCLGKNRHWSDLPVFTRALIGSALLMCLVWLLQPLMWIPT